MKKESVLLQKDFIMHKAGFVNIIGNPNVGKSTLMNALVGERLAQKWGWKIGDRIPLISPIYRKPDGTPWEFTIDGI